MAAPAPLAPRMEFREPPRSVPTEKELKVKVPVRLHVRLQAYRILEGKTITETVSEALDLYFRKIGVLPQAAETEAVAEGEAS